MEKPDALYYLCHIDNLESILKEGILSNQTIEDRGTAHQTIHNQEIIERRRNKTLPGGENLLGYVNLFFQPRNAMLYGLCCTRGEDKLVVLGVSASVMERPGSCFTDRIAAASKVRFFDDLKDLRHIDKHVLDREYWTDSDDTKQRMMAEVLVADRVPQEKIITVYTAKKEAKVSALLKAHRAEYAHSQRRMFFLPDRVWRITQHISLSRGDMFFSKLQTFTISVNLKGVMGKGLASRAKYQFPDAYVRYQDDCKSQKLKIGKPSLYKRAISIEKELAYDGVKLDPDKINGARWFLFLATKRHWREDSRFEDIEASMRWLVKNYEQSGIKSIALPALGCGLGNLQWKDVGPMMCHYLNKMRIKSCVYLPMDRDEDPQWLKPEYLLNTYSERTQKRNTPAPPGQSA